MEIIAVYFLELKLCMYESALCACICTYIPYMYTNYQIYSAIHLFALQYHFIVKFNNSEVSTRLTHTSFLWLNHFNQISHIEFIMRYAPSQMLTQTQYNERGCHCHFLQLNFSRHRLTVKATHRESPLVCTTVIMYRAQKEPKSEKQGSR